MSKFISTGTTALTHPINPMFDVIVGPIGVPAELAN
jgi:hypothetical protein